MQSFNFNNIIDIFNRMIFKSIIEPMLKSNLNDKWTVFAQPNIRYHLTGMVDSSSLNEHQWSAGIVAGLRMNLE